MDPINCGIRVRVDTRVSDAHGRTDNFEKNDGYDRRSKN
jgi:hypothetical protein